MVADVEAGVQPLLDDRGARVTLAVDVQLLLVDEDRDRHLLGLERSDQTVRDPLEVPEVRRFADHRTVVDRDGDAADGRLADAATPNGHQRHDDERQESSHRSAPSLP